MGTIKFGTDGWRAVISDDFTFANVKVVAQAMAEFICGEDDEVHRKREICLGYDTRFLSERYAELMASVFAANGVKVILSDRPCPTPSVSFTIKDRALTGGVMITASHNPPRYNGIKYKASFGGSAGPEIIHKIEARLGASVVREMAPAEAERQGLVQKENLIPRHLAFAKRFVDLKLLKRANLKVLADCMYGTGNSYLADLLSGGRVRVDTIHDERNPYFGGINPEPIMPNLQELAERTKKGRYAVGLATDGDADRLGVAGPHGKLLTGHKVMTLLLLHLLEDKGLTGDVVQTICGTFLIDEICRKHGLTMHETPVGFKYICDIMIKGNVLIGGEETGGISFKGYIPERDGILSGLLILEMLAMRKKSLTDILKAIDKEYGTYEYRRMDVRYPDEKKAPLMDFLKTKPLKDVLGRKVVQVKDYDGFKFICEDSSWLILRLSGTEPILRIYAEASTEKRALAILEFGKKVAYEV